MRLRHHHVLYTLTALVLGALLVISFALIAPRIRPVARDQIKQEATALVVQAQSTPPTSCDYPAGRYRMGICAPRAEMAYANLQAKIAGDPDDVRKLGPIGVDLSNNNGCSYSLAAHHATFAWFKFGEGTYFTDHCAASYVAQAKRLGIPYGGYEFVEPSPHVSPQAEGAAFAHRVFLVHALKEPLPPVVDAEINKYQLDAFSLNVWICGVVHTAEGYLHRRVDIYTGYWFWVGGNCGGSLLWEAAYAPYPMVPHAWSHRGWRHDVTTWQQSDGRFGPTPHLGADTDVMLHPERYGLHVKHGRLVKVTPPKPTPPKATPKPTPRPKRDPHKLAAWQRDHRLTHARLRGCGAHRAHASASFYCRHYRARNRRLHVLIAREGGRP